jgi:hypothetical protein
VLLGNVANANFLHGIFASNGADDRGGDRASGNVVVPQCLGVACS